MKKMKTKLRKNEVLITESKESHKVFGKIKRIEFPDKSKAYITNKGWTLITPNGTEILLKWNEIDYLLKYSVKWTKEMEKTKLRKIKCKCGHNKEYHWTLRCVCRNCNCKAFQKGE